MVLTLFDLDHTLLPLDTNQAWIQFLADVGAIDGEVMLPAAQLMKQRYLAGGADPDVVFCEFFIETLTRFSPATLSALRDQFIDEVVAPAISASARALIDAHRERGDFLGIITATNEFITRAVADCFLIDTLIATACERHGEAFTGRVSGIPSMRSGKVVRVTQWLASGALPGIRTRDQLEHLRFYSDSINDLALLEYADEPIAVNADPMLKRIATERNWQIITLH